MDPLNPSKPHLAQTSLHFVMFTLQTPLFSCRESDFGTKIKLTNTTAHYFTCGQFDLWIEWRPLVCKQFIVVTTMIMLDFILNNYNVYRSSLTAKFNNLLMKILR